MLGLNHINNIPIYTRLCDIQARKEQLKNEIRKSKGQIGSLWTSLFAQNKPSTKGEMLTSIISYSMTAFDAFMLVNKLTRQYGHLFGRKRKKK